MTRRRFILVRENREENGIFWTLGDAMKAAEKVPRGQSFSIAEIDIIRSYGWVERFDCIIHADGIEMLEVNPEPPRNHPGPMGA